LGTGTEFELSQENFQAMEPPDMTFMPVFIAKHTGILANPVTLRVTPLTVEEAEARGITNFTRPPDHQFSPSIASMLLTHTK
jgi:hypothetical protein